MQYGTKFKRLNVDIVQVRLIPTPDSSTFYFLEETVITSLFQGSHAYRQYINIYEVV